MLSAESARELYEGQLGKVPGALELIPRWEALLDNPVFQRYMAIEKHFRDGLDPMPDRDRFEDFLRGAGHEFAVVEVVPESSFFRMLLSRTPFFQIDYMALHGVVVARVLPTPRALTQAEVELVYATTDRILRGGRDWPHVSSAPAASRDFYQQLQATRFPAARGLVGLLNDMVKPKGMNLVGEHFKDVSACITSADKVITTAVALKNGHKSVTDDDAVEGAEALLRLFEVDLHQLPPFQRTGRSGYER